MLNSHANSPASALPPSACTLVSEELPPILCVSLLGCRPLI